MKNLAKLEFKTAWSRFKAEGFTFWMACLYMLFEYVRPQAIYRWIDFLPWTQIFILAALSGALLGNNKKGVRASPNKWLMLFGAQLVISCVYAYNSDIAFGHFSDYYTWVIVYFMLIHVVTSEARLFLILFVFFFACYKISLFGAQQWVVRGFSFASWGISGPPGYFQNSGELALLMAMFFCMSTGVYIGIKDKLSPLRRWVLLSLPVTAIMTNIMSSSRGSQLGLVAGLILFGIIYRKFSIKSLSLTAVFVFVVYLVLPQEQLARFQTAGDDDTSNTRLVYWGRGLEMMNNHPYTGVGHWNFPGYFANYYPQDQHFPGKREVSHNTFVQVGSTMGYPGIILYFFLILSGLKQTRVARRTIKKYSDSQNWLYHFALSLDVALISYMVGAIFMSVAFYPYLWIHLAFCVSTRVAAENTLAMEDGKATI